MKLRTKKLALSALILFALLGLAALIVPNFSAEPSLDLQPSEVSSPAPQSATQETGDTSSVARDAITELGDDDELDGWDFKYVPNPSDDLFTYEDAVAMLCQEVGQQECERLLGPMDSESQVSPTFAPTTNPQPRATENRGSSGNSFLGGQRPNFPLNSPQNRQTEPAAYLPCPKTREENPDGYERCHGGYVAPTFEFVGYQSCRKVDDPTFGLVVQVTGRIRLVGGNFVSSEWGPQSGLQGENSYRNVSSTHYFEHVEGAAVLALSWYERFRIGSMDVTNTYVDWIDTVVSHGLYLVDINEMDPACLSD